MLPHVQPQQADDAFFHRRRVLIGRGGDCEGVELLIIVEPSPAGAEDLKGRECEHLLELGERTETLLQPVEQQAIGLTTAVWRHCAEEEVVVDVAASRVAHLNGVVEEEKGVWIGGEERR